MAEFKEFRKIPRLTRECIITEKIDGTNVCIVIEESSVVGSYLLWTQSRKRIITPDDDHYGFSKWAYENKEELLKLGVGYHYGEWWGSGINKRYTIDDRRFYLFNTDRWSNKDSRPSCCGVVPVLYRGIFSTREVYNCLELLETNGSIVDPECKRPEGVVIYHIAGDVYFKKTIEKDDEYKGKNK